MVTTIIVSVAIGILVGGLVIYVVMSRNRVKYSLKYPDDWLNVRKAEISQAAPGVYSATDKELYEMEKNDAKRAKADNNETII